jgi:hypothetical protein
MYGLKPVLFTETDVAAGSRSDVVAVCESEAARER